MNYKRFFKSQSLRHKILKMLSFIPDKTMLNLQYKIKFGRWPDLKNPKRYTEKIQLYKLNYRNPLMHICVDKYKVKEYVATHYPDLHLPKLYGVYEDANDIDFEYLPMKFVIKTNDGGGANNVIVCHDKTKLNWPETVRKLNSWINVKDVNPGREWAYTGIPKSVIIIEELLVNPKNPEGGIEDFKFFCFDGEPYCVVIDGDRYISHKRNFYDLQWNNLNIGSDCMNFKKNVSRPENLDAMITAARELSQGFPFVRVDLYSVDNTIYFGELTFYPWSGYVQFKPDDFDFRLGEKFDVSSFT